ncbi:MAG TPA: Flp family type IVb pilin [Sphingomicrobium sp.]|nr:Flp family type IVb pilin [Sphingomicrobium sp.]
MSAIRIALRAIRRNERGVTAVEYGLIASLIAVAAIGGMQALGGGSQGLWGKIESYVTAAMT